MPFQPCVGLPQLRIPPFSPVRIVGGFAPHRMAEPMLPHFIVHPFILEPRRKGVAEVMNM